MFAVPAQGSATIGDEGEILIDGMEVGNLFGFIVNCIVSMTFDFIGFLLTTMLATSHAARAGSRAGLGITMIRYGLVVMGKASNPESRYYSGSRHEQNGLISWILIIIVSARVM
jgi:hypothetical protein